MTSESAPIWFLDVNGTKTGPYTLEQVAGLLHDGEIRAEFLVTAQHLNGQWISVHALLNHQVQTTPQSGPFEPPPRPYGVEEEKTGSITVNRDDDPTLVLFNALQVSKKKKAKDHSGDADDASWENESRGRKIPSQLMMIFAIAGLASLLIWGSLKLIAQREAGAEKESALIERDHSNVRTSASSHAGGRRATEPRHVPRPEPVRQRALTAPNSRPSLSNPRPAPAAPVAPPPSAADRRDTIREERNRAEEALRERELERERERDRERQNLDEDPDTGQPEETDSWDRKNRPDDRPVDPPPLRDEQSPAYDPGLDTGQYGGAPPPEPALDGEPPPYE